jgi:copper oxidase (laccase) domain-containing protein
MSTRLDRIEYLDKNIGFFPIFNNTITNAFSWGENVGNMSFNYGSRKEVKLRIIKFLQKISINNIQSIVNIEPEHSDNIVSITQNKYNSLRPTPVGKSIHCDTLFTNTKNIALSIKPADCTVSIIKAIDINNKIIIGLIHAGRKGLDLSLPYKSIEYLIQHYEVNVSNIQIGIVPSIGFDNYFIQDIEELKNPIIWENYSKKKNNYIYLDLKSLLLKQYQDIGIKNTQIQYYDLDTFNYAKEKISFSHRYSQMHKETANGRMIVVVKI